MRNDGLMVVFKICLDFLACAGWGYAGWNAGKPWLGVWSALALFVLLLLLILGM